MSRMRSALIPAQLVPMDDLSPDANTLGRHPCDPSTQRTPPNGGCNLQSLPQDMEPFDERGATWWTAASLRAEEEPTRSRNSRPTL